MSDQGVRAFYKKFIARRPTVVLIVAAVLLPNAVFFVAMALGIGTPVRAVAILAYLVVGLLARHVRPWLVVALYAGVFAYDVASTTALLFGLSFVEMFTVLKFALEVRLFASPLYLGAGFGLVVSAVLALRLLIGKRTLVRKAGVFPALVAGLVVMGLDVAVNSIANYQFGTAFAQGKPFASALKSSGLSQRLDRQTVPRNVLVVMVESLGVFKNPDHRALLEQPFTTPEVAERYDVRWGDTVYYGSTTAAEMRELCASRRTYQSLLSGPKTDCLPKKMADLGYQTLAVHGFSSRMFERQNWYPELGFQSMLFAEDLAPLGWPRCGAVFLGMCDTDVLRYLGTILKTARKPTFLYMLSLNTHIPVAPKPQRGPLDCRGGGRFGDKEVCNMAGMWAELFAAVAALALSPQNAPLDILIVGDHAPPLWSRQQRGLFKPGRVPWLLLSAKAIRADQTP